LFNVQSIKFSIKFKAKLSIKIFFNFGDIKITQFLIIIYKNKYSYIHTIFVYKMSHLEENNIV